MFEMIPSKNYRRFMKSQVIEFSDWDKATLIYNHRIALYDEKLRALLEIQKNTSDEFLKKQIEERLSRDKMYYEKFKENDGNAFYRLFTWYDGRYDEEGCYLDFKVAYEDGLKEGNSFRINKELLECKKKAGDTNGVFGGVGFSPEGYRNDTFWLYSENEEDAIERANNQCFENRYVDMPLMFRRKDIVHVIGTELYGIVDGPINDKDELLYRNCAKNGDYSDWQVTVNLIYDGQKFLSVFSHDHIAPADLEYAEFENGDLRKGMLEYMVKTLYESSWLGGGGRDVGRIQAILSALETVWRQYLDMRLGQLLINVCGKTDLFAIEDEIILERLQHNTFPIRD